MDAGLIAIFFSHNFRTKTAKDDKTWTSEFGSYKYKPLSNEIGNL